MLIGRPLKIFLIAGCVGYIDPILTPALEGASADARKVTYLLESGKSVNFNNKNLLNPWFVVR